MNDIKHIFRMHLKKSAFFRLMVFLFRAISFRSCRGSSPTWTLNKRQKFKLNELTIAIICDDMTWENLRGLCKLVYLRPDNWFFELERTKPDLFFCEAAWQGVSEQNYGWSGRIARDVNLRIENRGALKRILQYCQRAKIPTVFWNKEDPHADDAYYRFTDTALLFDHICTTAVESIPRYQEEGHQSVHLMPFGISPQLFYPLEEAGVENSAVFFGSWYQTYPQRCQDTEQLFDWVLASGMKLTIYDRCSESYEPERQFPEKYRPYIRPAVPYSEIRDELKQYRYVLNINTETNSETMFARRVFEIMACGRVIISNKSVGMKKLFPDSIWYFGESFNLGMADQYIAQNQAYVLTYQTMEYHFLNLMKTLEVISL